MEQRVFHVIRAMGTDSERREKFLNIGKNPWEIERKPVPDESEADPSPNTGNNWHSGSSTNLTDSLAAERTRNLTIGREGRSALSQLGNPWFT